MCVVCEIEEIIERSNLGEKDRLFIHSRLLFINTVLSKTCDVLREAVVEGCFKEAEMSDVLKTAFVLISTGENESEARKAVCEGLEALGISELKNITKANTLH